MPGADALQRPLRSGFRRRRCSTASGSRRRIMPRLPTPRPVPRPQATSPHEEREVSVPGQRGGTSHAVPLLLVTSGHRAGDGTWEPRPSRSRQNPSCTKGLSITSPFSHGAGGLPRKQSQHLAAHDAPPARIAVGELLNGIGPLGLALHTAVRRGGAELSAASYLTYARVLL